MERAPSKRRVKFVPKHLQQVDFDLDDSDEDSVFDIKQQLGEISVTSNFSFSFFLTIISIFPHKHIMFLYKYE